MCIRDRFTLYSEFNQNQHFNQTMDQSQNGMQMGMGMGMMQDGMQMNGMAIVGNQMSPGGTQYQEDLGPPMYEQQQPAMMQHINAPPQSMMMQQPLQPMNTLQPMNSMPMNVPASTMQPMNSLQPMNPMGQPQVF
eukprot:TRINITY_DN4156_c0_g1_i1.p1 TRINITY_DN4156_c0_g1~~TRINITY_DN4156_c0_g1_i1.p1  ORF type:complete len:135 (-),score=27.83 TRINITY_DN4156_c0_g1_i1:26-430(-)